MYRHATKPNRYGICLESFRCAGRRLTTKEAVARYFARCTNAAGGHLAPKSNADRAAAAEAELAAAVAELPAFVAEVAAPLAEVEALDADVAAAAADAAAEVELPNTESV